MAKPAGSQSYLKLPRKGDVIRTSRYGDVTVNAVMRYGRSLFVTGEDGEEHMVHRADDEKWLRVPRAGAPSDVPEAAVHAAAEVMLRQYRNEYDVAHLTWGDFAAAAREVLEAALPHLH
jgi:hypothetical protein